MSKASRPSRRSLKSSESIDISPGTEPPPIMARAPLERMLRIHQLVQGKGKWNGANLELELEACLTTIRKDIRYMQDFLRLPIRFDYTKNHYIYTHPVKEFPAVQLSQRELLELAIARYACDSIPGLGQMTPLAGVMKKLLVGPTELVTVSGEAIERYFSFIRVGSTRPIPAEMFEQVNVALLESREMHFDYYKPDGRPPRRRVVRPLHLTWYEHTCYLISQEVSTRAYRTFALGRASNLVVRKRTFKRPADFDVAEYFAKAFGIYGGDTAEEVCVRFRNPAAFFVKERFWHPTQVIEERKDGTIEARFQVAVTPEFERWVLGWGACATVVAPRSLDDRIYASALEIVERRHAAERLRPTVAG